MQSCWHPKFITLDPCHHRCVQCGAVRYPKYQEDYNLYEKLHQFIGCANMSYAEELINCIIKLETLLGSPYYDDGYIVIQSGISYLKKKLSDSPFRPQ